MTLSLIEQLAIFDANAVLASERLEAYVQTRSKWDLICLARTRLIDGFDEYGDLIVRQGLQDRNREIDEELADALNRLAMNG